jgi:hypothetical protein
LTAAKKVDTLKSLKVIVVPMYLYLKKKTKKKRMVVATYLNPKP